MNSELKSVAKWAAVLFLPAMFLGMYITAPHGGLQSDSMFPVGIFIILPWVVMHDYSGLGSGAAALLAYPAQYFWCLPWVALVRWFARNAADAKNKP